MLWGVFECPYTWMNAVAFILNLCEFVDLNLFLIKDSGLNFENNII